MQLRQYFCDALTLDKEQLTLEVCQLAILFTGYTKDVDTAGRVDRFRRIWHEVKKLKPLKASCH